jgi:ubiquinone/menaquinone biosynthesis C-methylase UbiE
VSWLFAAIYDPFMRKSEIACLREWRGELLGSLEGRVLEIGAGTGANLPFYPPTLERLVVTDPDEHMLKRLADARAGSGPRRAPEIVQAPADALPFADRAFDVVVSTLVLCSVPDVDRTLAEIRRVLVPGGRLVFLEHVAAGNDQTKRRRWQGRVEPFWKRIAGNCHLTRDTAGSLTNAGFALHEIKNESMRKALPLVRPTIRGVAISPPG